MADNDNLVNADAAVDKAFQGVQDTDTELNKAFSQPTAEPSREPAMAVPMTEAPTPNEPINVINPEGKLVSIPHTSLQDALTSGYQVATPEHIEAYKKEQKYGSLGQQAITGLEGAASGLSFGLSTGLEEGIGVNPEDIRARREVNPGIHGLGEATGLVAGALALPGAGAAGLLTKAGEGAAELAGLEGTTALSKIGSGVVKGLVENALFQGGDEVSKMLSGDPNQSVETAVTDIGLSSLLGGGIGGALGGTTALWNATAGSKVGKYLQTLTDRLGGVDGATPDIVGDAATKAGIALKPEIKAGLSNDPYMRQAFQSLQESTTKSGVEAQEALKAFKNQTGEAIGSSLGKTPDQVKQLEGMSDYESGDSLKKTLIQSLKEKIDPISQQFDEIKEKYKNLELPQDVSVVPVESKQIIGKPQMQEVYTADRYTPLQIPVSEVETKIEPVGKAIDVKTGQIIKPGVSSEISDRIAQLANEKGWTASPSSEEMGMINKIYRELPGLKTLNDLRNYQSLIGDEAARKQLWHLGSQVKGIFRDVEDRIVTSKLGEDAPELLQQHLMARDAYKNAMNTIEDLNDRIRVGRYNGPGSFIRALEEMAPEDVLRRLSPKGDAGVINLLSERFPEAAEKLKDYHISQLLKSSMAKAGEGELLNSRAFFTALDKMSPEAKAFLASPEIKAKLDAIQGLVEAIPSKMNTSGTAKTLDSLWEYVPASAAGLATALIGHNPALGLLMAGLTKVLGRDLPDATRLAMLKFLGSNKSIEPSAFKNMVEYIHATIKGENLTSKAVENVFKAGKEVLPQSQFPNEKDRNKLDKQLKQLRSNPDPLLKSGGNTSYYLPEHGEAIGQTAQNAVNYLNSIRPNTERAKPLDSKPIPSQTEQSEYNRALNIAQQPLILLDKIKQGTLNQSEVQILQKLYPSLYSKLSTKLLDQISNPKDTNQPIIPYKTRLALSTFLGQPLDSTLTPQSIQAAQSPAIKQKQNEENAKNNIKAFQAKSLDKLPNQYQTPAQAREQRKTLKS
jgi:hypothetical protein